LQEAVRLVTDPVDALGRPRGLEATRGGAQQGVEVVAVVEAFAGDFQLEPFGGAVALARVERGVGRRERAGRLETPEGRGPREEPGLPPARDGGHTGASTGLALRPAGTDNAWVPRAEGEHTPETQHGRDPVDRLRETAGSYRLGPRRLRDARR